MKTVFLIFTLFSAALLLLPGTVVPKVGTIELPLSETALTDVPSPTVSALPLDAKEGTTADTDGYDVMPSDTEVLPTTLTLQTDAGEVALCLEDYVAGVLWAELYLSFDDAAWQALAVATRTFAVYRTEHGLPFYDDSAVCCAYFSEDDAKLRFGEQYEAMKTKAHNAVNATAGEILLYNGAAACTMYHAMSQGSTASAETVLGTAVPYLVSCTTPEYDITGLVRDISITQKDCLRIAGAGTLPIGVTYDTDGRAEIVTFADGTEVSGTAFRSMFGLPSTDFSVVSEDSSSVTLRVRGFGHGIGLSQWGAQIMAQTGASYREILAHYYPGTELANHVP